MRLIRDFVLDLRRDSQECSSGVTISSSARMRVRVQLLRIKKRDAEIERANAVGDVGDVGADPNNVPSVLSAVNDGGDYGGDDNDDGANYGGDWYVCISICAGQHA
jgi:hypothetical protein